MDHRPLYLVAGARPNFIKLAPLAKTLKNRLPFKIVHTGQHYDSKMSKSFFEVLDIPPADFNLEVGSGSHGEQTARIIERFERLLLEQRPSAVVVFGDVNSTLACAVASSKLLVPVVHVEAGLRSDDRTMPEEINRIVTDALSDLMLVSEKSGMDHLRQEGVSLERTRLVGNIMIDSLIDMLPIALGQNIVESITPSGSTYAFVTLHRPSNVDQPETLLRLLSVLNDISHAIRVVFPVHPRTRQKIRELNFVPNSRLQMMEPVDYLTSLALQSGAKLILSDSGGVQEEAAFLRIPCLTLRENTERPVTVELGTSTLVGNDPRRILTSFNDVMSGRYKKGCEIPLWDGKTRERISTHLEKMLSSIDCNSKAVRHG